MIIVHIAANAPYNDYWGYQENLLPKYHKKLGHEVLLITTNKKHKDGQIAEIEEQRYILDDGVKVIRKKYKQYRLKNLTGIMTYIPAYDLLCEQRPDFIFYHGLVSITIKDVIKYKKENPNCIVVEDNHLDYNIGNQCRTIKEKLIRQWLRMLNKYSIKYIDKVYGVTPWRKTYAEDYFAIPSNITDVLLMGADDEYVDFSNRLLIRKRIREKYNIGETEFLIVSGGKIDEKKKIDVLMAACSKTDLNVKLLIFGSVSETIKDKFEQLLFDNRIIYAGWIDSTKVYDYFFAADLVFFPGQHSVLWEQACASKVPCVFEKWEGMEHVNNGGNSDFIASVSIENIYNKIKELHFTEKYYKMKEIAESNATDIYLYSKIAEKSLECVRK